MPPHPHPAAPGFASRQLPGVGAPPFWEPKDLEVELKPLFGCKIGEDDWGQGKECDPDWDDNTAPEEPPPPIVHGGYCGSVPSEVETIGFDCDRHRCSLDSCNDATALCWPINSGQYSPKSRAIPLFSYSEWNNGRLENADCSIIRVIAYHINTCGLGDQVHIAISAWWSDGWPILKAVEAASARGAIVRIITGVEDQDPWFHTATWIGDRLKATIGPQNVRHWSSKKAFPNISHNKFVLINRGKFGQHMVLISGANWAPFDIARHCDLLTVNSWKIWSAFLTYWNALWSSQENGEPTWYPTEFEDPEAGLSAHFWPVLNIVGEPEVDGGASLKNPFLRIIRRYKAEAATKIRIIAASWHYSGSGEDPGLASGPGKDLVDELVKYREDGADVRVIGNHHLDPRCHSSWACQVQPGMSPDAGSCETTNGVWKELEDNQIPWAKCPPHAKILMISGIHKSDNKWHQAVYTGSMNFSYEWGVPIPDVKAGAMADSFIGVHDDPVIFSQYEEWWKWLCQNSAIGAGGPSPVCGDEHPFSPSPKPLKAVL